MTFSGYRRPDGRVGVRNYVAVMSSVSCANGVVESIGRTLPEIKTITHTEGCGRAREDLRIAGRTLVGLGTHPNVAAVLVIGLGCEALNSGGLAERIQVCGKPVEVLGIQDAGGTRKATERGVEIARKLLDYASEQNRVPCEWGELIVGLECGGSDAFSGVTANPVVGAFSDRLVEHGGSVIFSETTEMFGTEEILANKAATNEVREQLMTMIAEQLKSAREAMGPQAGTAIAPGNADGGLTTIMEKSLGCIIKAGSTPIRQVVKYAERVTEKGVVAMDTPGSDVFSMTGMAAGGAQIMIFTTGRGTPTGFPIVPVIKVSSNNDTFERMRDDMDVNAGKVIDGASIDSVSEELLDFVAGVAEGEETAAELNRQEMLAIHTTGQAF